MFKPGELESESHPPAPVRVLMRAGVRCNELLRPRPKPSPHPSPEPAAVRGAAWRVPKGVRRFGRGEKESRRGSEDQPN
jgi:hypothetical protein